MKEKDRGIFMGQAQITQMKGKWGLTRFNFVISKEFLQPRNLDDTGLLRFFPAVEMTVGAVEMTVGAVEMTDKDGFAKISWCQILNSGMSHAKALKS